MIVLTDFDGVFGNYGNRSFNSLNLCFPENFFLIFRKFLFMMNFLIFLLHAGTITAFIVGKDESWMAFSTNTTENIANTARNVDKALPFIEMIEVSALYAERFS